MTDKEMDWNQSDATMRRIDEILQQCHAAAFTDEYTAWLKALNNLRRECLALVEEDRLDSVEGHISKARNAINRYNTDDVKARKHLDAAEAVMRRAMQERNLLVKESDTVRPGRR